MLFYLWTEGWRDLSNPSQKGINLLVSNIQASAGAPCLGENQRPPQSGPFSATTLLRGAAGEMVFLTVRNSQEGEGSFHWDLEGWVRLSLTVVGYGSSGRAEHEPA